MYHKKREVAGRVQSPDTNEKPPCCLKKELLGGKSQTSMLQKWHRVSSGTLLPPHEMRGDSLPARQLGTAHRFLNAEAHRPASPDVTLVHRTLVFCSRARGRHHHSPHKSNSIAGYRKGMKNLSSREIVYLSRFATMGEDKAPEHRVPPQKLSKIRKCFGNQAVCLLIYGALCCGESIRSRPLVLRLSFAGLSW